MKFLFQVEDGQYLEDPGQKLEKAREFKATGNSLFGCGKFLAAKKWYAHGNVALFHLTFYSTIQER